MPLQKTPVLLVIWLYGIAALVALMAIVGAATRLTDSGLSITEWQPLLGAIPPLSEADWQTAFDKYRAIPEYQLVNKGMSLDAFKVIYWWEWAHRFLGRIIGLYVIVPLAAFWWRGSITPSLGVKLLGLVALGGLQGVIGWYMVASGLVDRVDVSQYRLALHLTVAVLIFAASLWIAFGVTLDRETRGSPSRPAAPLWPRLSAIALMLVMLLQVFFGGLVAGLDAGMVANTWPSMDGAFVPDGLLVMQPSHLNLFENALTVQFIHRLLAYLIAAWAIVHMVIVARSIADSRSRWSSRLLAIGVFGQIAIGIVTLLAMVPIGLGLLHQAGALAVIALLVWHLKALHPAMPKAPDLAAAT